MECTQELHNFIHLCKMAADRQQLLQAYLSTGSLFLPTVQAVGEYVQLYNSLIQESARTAGLTKETVCEVSDIIYKGTKYSKGLAVIINHNEHGYVYGNVAFLITVILISHK